MKNELMDEYLTQQCKGEVDVPYFLNALEEHTLHHSKLGSANFDLTLALLRQPAIRSPNQLYQFFSIFWSLPSALDCHQKNELCNAALNLPFETLSQEASWVLIDALDKLSSGQHIDMLKQIAKKNPNLSEALTILSGD